MVLHLTNLDSIWTNNSTEEVEDYTKDNFDLRIGIGTTTNVDALQLKVAGTSFHLT